LHNNDLFSSLCFNHQLNAKTLPFIKREKKFHFPHQFISSSAPFANI